MGDPSILVLEDDEFTRTLLVGTLSNLGFRNVFPAATASEAVRIAGESRPKVALLDLHLGIGPTGIDVAERLRSKNPLIGLVFLTSFTDPRLAGNFPELPEGSVYLVKSSVAETDFLEIAIRHAYEHPLASATKAARVATNDSGIKLTNRQKDVLRYVAHGYTNAEIARLEGVGEGAVEKTVQRLAAALDIEPQPGRNIRVLIAGAYFQRVRKPH